jgi:hypothetical protein
MRASLAGCLMPHPAPGQADVTWDPAAPDVADWTLTLSNRSAQSKQNSSNPLIISNISRVGGKRYAEIKFNYDTGFGNTIHQDVGATRGTSGDLDLRGLGVAYNRTGRVFRNNVDLGDLCPAISSGDTVMIALDLDNLQCWLGKGGVWATGDPATLTDPTVTGLTAGTYYMAAAHESYLGFDTYVIAGNSSNVIYTVPAGFAVWGTT